MSAEALGVFPGDGAIMFPKPSLHDGSGCIFSSHMSFIRIYTIESHLQYQLNM